jgi:hypothetical protein
MPTEEKRHQRHAKRIKLSFVLMTLLFFLIVGGFMWLLLDIRDISRKTASLSKATARLTLENTKRIDEIQKSRTFSCKQTYRGVRNVFRPFFPKHPSDKKQARTIQKFNRTIDALIAGCESQTKPKSGGG